jgi:predicted transcriptional regulator
MVSKGQKQQFWNVVHEAPYVASMKKIGELMFTKEEYIVKVSKIMTQSVFRISEDSTAQKAAEKMGEKHIGSLIVTRNGMDVGIVTERDILSKCIAKKKSLEKIRVKEISSKPIIKIDKNKTGEDALEKMANNNVRRLLVTDNNEIAGIFTTSDVTRLVSIDKC